MEMLKYPDYYGFSLTVAHSEIRVVKGPGQAGTG